MNEHERAVFGLLFLTATYYMLLPRFCRWWAQCVGGHWNDWRWRFIGKVFFLFIWCAVTGVVMFCAINY